MGSNNTVDGGPIHRMVAVDNEGNPVYASQGSSFNDVDVTNLPTTVDTNSGNKSASTIRTVLATDQPALTNALKVEEQFSYSRKTADGQVKGSAGFIHTIIVTPTAATSTAGVITIYDSLTETGSVVASIYVPTNNTQNIIYPLDVVCSTGIYVGYDATASDHSVTVSYR